MAALSSRKNSAYNYTDRCNTDQIPRIFPGITNDSDSCSSSSSTSSSSSSTSSRSLVAMQLHDIPGLDNFTKKKEKKTHKNNLLQNFNINNNSIDNTIIHNNNNNNNSNTNINNNDDEEYIPSCPSGLIDNVEYRACASSLSPRYIPSMNESNEKINELNIRSPPLPPTLPIPPSPGIKNNEMSTNMNMTVHGEMSQTHIMNSIREQNINDSSQLHKDGRSSSKTTKGSKNTSTTTTSAAATAATTPDTFVISPMTTAHTKINESKKTLDIPSTSVAGNGCRSSPPPQPQSSSATTTTTTSSSSRVPPKRRNSLSSISSMKLEAKRHKYSSKDTDNIDHKRKSTGIGCTIVNGVSVSSTAATTTSTSSTTSVSSSVLTSALVSPPPSTTTTSTTASTISSPKTHLAGGIMSTSSSSNGKSSRNSKRNNHVTGAAAAGGGAVNNCNDDSGNTNATTINTNNSTTPIGNLPLPIEITNDIVYLTRINKKSSFDVNLQIPLKYYKNVMPIFNKGIKLDLFVQRENSENLWTNVTIKNTDGLKIPIPIYKIVNVDENIIKNLNLVLNNTVEFKESILSSKSDKNYKIYDESGIIRIGSSDVVATIATKSNVNSSNSIATKNTVTTNTIKLNSLYSNARIELKKNCTYVFNLSLNIIFARNFINIQTEHFRCSLNCREDNHYLACLVITCTENHTIENGVCLMQNIQSN